MKKRPPQNSEEFLLAFSEVIDETPMSVADFGAALTDAGVDVPAFLARGRAILEAEAEQRRGERKRHALEARARFVNAFEQIHVKVPPTISALKEFIREFASGAHGAGLQQAAVVQWRKYENATEEDLRALAEDLLKLKMLAESEGESGKAS